MTAFPATSIYAAILTVLFLALSVRVIARRRASRILLGTTGNPDLERAARAHANFAEYVPLGLVLLMLIEHVSPAWLLHAVGVALVLGRIAHAAALWRPAPAPRLRAAGMTLTFTALTIPTAILLWTAIRTLA